MDWMGYLILDKATSLLFEDSLKKFTNDNRLITFVPSGLKRYFQTLDVSVNGSFKKTLREK